MSGGIVSIGRPVISYQLSLTFRFTEMGTPDGISLVQMLTARAIKLKVEQKNNVIVREM